MYFSLLQVVLGYKSQPKTYLLTTPTRRHSVKRIVRHSYPIMFDEMAKGSASHRNMMIKALARVARSEVMAISSNPGATIFASNKEELHNFSWDKVWIELMKCAPVLMKLLGSLLVNPMESKPMLCLMACMLLKKNRSLAFVQRCISILFH